MATRAFDQQYRKFVDEQIAWQKRHADRTMMQFIGLRLTLVLVSAALPALTIIESRLWVIGASVLIAVLTGLDTQFQWGDEWRHFRSTQLALERARREYDKGLSDASHATSRERARAEQKNSASFHNEVESILQKDTDQFFKFRITPWKARVTE